MDFVRVVLVLAALGLSAPSFASTRTEPLFVLKERLDRLEEADTLPEQQLAAAIAYHSACRAAWGAGSWREGACLARVARAHAANADPDKAVATYRTALTLLSKGGVGATADIASARTIMADLLTDGPGDAEADRLFALALASRIDLFGERSAETIETLFLRANRAMRRSRFDEAERDLLRADVASKELELPVAIRVSLMALLGKVAQRLGRYPEAETRLLATLAEMDKTFDPIDPRRHIALTPLICPLLSGPKSVLDLVTKEEWNGEETQAGRDHLQAA